MLRRDDIGIHLTCELVVDGGHQIVVVETDERPVVLGGDVFRGPHVPHPNYS